MILFDIPYKSLDRLISCDHQESFYGLNCLCFNFQSLPPGTSGTIGY